MSPDAMDSEFSNEDSVETQVSSTDQEVRTWSMILHLSVFAGYLVPFAGLIAPIVIWQVKKSSMPSIDAHGRIVINAMLSYVIYAFICVLLIYIFIGIILLPLLALLAIICPIIGAVKASENEAWPYPLSIGFF